MTPYKKYDQYKDSGVAGLEQIPATWRVLSWKRALKAESGGTVIKNTAFSEPGENRFPAYSASGQDVWLSSYMFDVPGLVISAVGARCGRVFHAKEKWGVVANTACAFPKKNTDLRYMWYVVNQPDWWEIGGSAQPYVKISESLDRIGVLPPLPEQRAIADYLDRETAKIDALIDKKTRLVELLEEKRQATISHAVTKGLDPNAPMKDSGVPWLGEVPAHWEVMRVKRLGRTAGGAGFPHEHQGDDTQEIPFFKVGNLSGGMNSSDHTVSKETARMLGATVFPAGTITFAKVGAALLLNRRIVMPVAGCLDNNLMALVVTSADSPEWIRTQLRLIDFGELVNPGAVPSINQEQVDELRIALPPIDEQSTLLDYAEHLEKHLYQLCTSLQKSIDLLREKRSALITAAVTGQIDVRDEVLG